MITHTFQHCFNDVPLPACGTESSRFFVDKARARELLGEHYPISQVLFLAMVNWAQDNAYNHIYTIVSRAMLKILKRSGWQISVVKEAFLTEKERIYLLTLPAGEEDKQQLGGDIVSRTGCAPVAVTTWPLTLPV
jgi:acyl homoserine lactone synthase